jgi:hypothetical protein
MRGGKSGGHVIINLKNWRRVAARYGRTKSSYPALPVPPQHRFGRDEIFGIRSARDARCMERQFLWKRAMDAD